MKKILALLLAAAMMIVVFTSCSCFLFTPAPTQAAETTSATEEETAEATETTQKATQKVTSTDEFPTEGDDDNDDNDDTDDNEGHFVEPQGRWRVEVPEIWDEYGDIVVTKNGNSVKFVYKKAYEEYKAGHVFTICTTAASNKVDVTNYPHAEEIYLDKNIQIYVLYPTDVQYGGLDGSDMEKEAPEYNALYNTREDIIDSLEVI